MLQGVHLSQIAVYSFCILFAQQETGLIFIDNYYGVRRPGTNRLKAGGYPLVGLQGGAWHMLNSELAYNADDLTDVQSGLYYAYNQVCSQRTAYRHLSKHLVCLEFMSTAIFLAITSLQYILASQIFRGCRSSPKYALLPCSSTLVALQF